jgi:hypothetical protein
MRPGIHSVTVVASRQRHGMDCRIKSGNDDMDMDMDMVANARIPVG